MSESIHQTPSQIHLTTKLSLGRILRQNDQEDYSSYIIIEHIHPRNTDQNDPTSRSVAPAMAVAAKDAEHETAATA